MTDLILAIAHHLLVFALVAVMAIEAALVRPGLSTGLLPRLAKIDAGYGALAMTIIAVGIGRVVFGAKGADFYLSNPWFWGKMIAFAAIGILSIGPTLTFTRWRRAASADPAFAPPAQAIQRIRRFIIAELALLPIVLACAAAMARYGGF